ncbi:MAG: isopentenyl-diphosphate Delta-isomerase [bacterium]
MTTTATEEVVLCDEEGRAIGTAPKATVHNARTPLHLAFSCYVFDADARLLVTRRAVAKRTWPGVRTNTCCGHPGSGEAMAEAVSRRLRGELGLSVPDLRLVLPRFRYRAEMADGTVENELCPVWTATVDRGVTGPDATPDTAPDPDEVGAAWWQPWPDFVAAAADAADPLSPWALVQLPQLVALGPEPLRWPTADLAELPAAARR